MTYTLAQLTGLPGFAGHSAPPAWGFDHEGLFIQPAAATDFWQRTYYGFSTDNGPFLFTRCAFTELSVKRSLNGMP